MRLIMLIYAIVGFMLTVLSIPLIFKKIPPNRWYGVRIQLTFNDPNVWYLANAYAGKRILVVGLSSAVGAILLYSVPGITYDAYLVLCVAIFMVTFGVSAYQIERYNKSFSKK